MAPLVPHDMWSFLWLICSSINRHGLIVSRVWRAYYQIMYVNLNKVCSQLCHNQRPKIMSQVYDPSFSNTLPSNGENIIHMLTWSHEYSSELWKNINPRNIFMNHNNQRRLWKGTVNGIFLKKIFLFHKFFLGSFAFTVLFVFFNSLSHSDFEYIGSFLHFDPRIFKPQ